MNQYDKDRFDVFVHLTDIPMLGKQYVPGLWRQIEDGNNNQSNQFNTPRPSAQTPPINQRPPPTVMLAGPSGTPSTSGSNAAVGGIARTIEKRSFPTTSSDEPSTSTPQDPQAKIPRLGNNWQR
ncbi:unnamed protein product [Caenorhabditis nigoni]